MSRARLLTALVALALAGEARAFDPPPDWRVEKCARYRAAWDEALKRFGRAGVSEDFLARHAAFIARGCDDPRDVCPRSQEELALADVMTLRAMNAGTASTFLPFACPR